jgi:hypothetical protein
MSKRQLFCDIVLPTKSLRRQAAMPENEIREFAAHHTLTMASFQGPPLHLTKAAAIGSRLQLQGVCDKRCSDPILEGVEQQQLQRHIRR